MIGETDSTSTDMLADDDGSVVDASSRLPSSDGPEEPARAPLDTNSVTGETTADDIPDEDDDEDEVVDMNVKPLEEAAPDETDPEKLDKQWFILKVQSNRENSIADALRRQVAIRGLDGYFGDILVPTEDVAEFKNGKRRVVKRKLYPGYIVVNMALTEETWFVVRETPGIGDFTGAIGKPSPMLPGEIEPILRTMYPPEEGSETIKTAIPFKMGNRVRIKDGTFENFEGEVESIDEANGRVTVIINIFGRSTPVELEHWQMEAV